MSKEIKERILYGIAFGLIIGVIAFITFDRPRFNSPEVVINDGGNHLSASELEKDGDMSQYTLPDDKSSSDNNNAETSSEGFKNEVTEKETDITQNDGFPTNPNAVKPNDKSAANSPANASFPININSASAEELQALDGIGPTLSKRIVDYRNTHGGFSSIEEIMEVSGIGEKRFAAIRDKIIV